MLFYPKMPDSRNFPSGRCTAFEKYDGTNLHWDWERGFGWHAFGTRRDEFNLTANGIEGFAHAHAELAEAPDVFLATLAERIERMFNDHAWYCAHNSLRVFTEFMGPSSFAGRHKTGEPKALILFDVWADTFGMLGPQQFVRDFGQCRMARVVYEGRLTGTFADHVREGKYNVGEGVVCKIGLGGDDVWMCKIKTNAYRERLKLAFADNWEQYWE